MVELLLSERTTNEKGDDHDAAKDCINILNKLESIVWGVITSEGRSEARLWLCKTISCFTSVTPQAQCEVFLKLLRTNQKIGLAKQLLQLIFEKRLPKVAAIVADKSYVLKRFFKGHPKRILQWFGDFATGAEAGHKGGARALSQFAFVNRDICWEELEWKGKHGQSPAVVASKPHYFLDLDVQRTVENFLEYVPEFWSSKELAESVKDGELLLMDTQFFVDCLIDFMYEKDLEEVWDVISDFLVEESFSSLCQRLLLIFEDSDICLFLNALFKFHTLKVEPKIVGNPSYWLELLLHMHGGCASIDELLLLNTVIIQGRQLFRIVHNEEHEEEKRKIAELIVEIRTTSNGFDAFVVRECLKMKRAESVKWLGLLSWVLHYRLSEECGSPESWEALFIKSGIKFRKAGSYDLLDTDGFLEESEPSFIDEGSTTGKKRKSRKKRRRYYGDDDGDRDVLGDGNASCRQTFLPAAGSWLLSSDDYTSSWNSVDLPEYLAKHCFSTWMKWLSSRWSFR